MAQATIKKGASGPAVVELQGLLAAAGFPSSDPSGVFGDATDAAVKSFQTAKGLTVDGIVGPNTWAALTGTKPVPGGATDKNAQFGRGVLESVWQEVTGLAPNLAELQISGAQARLESGYGKAPYKLLDHASPCNDPKNAIVLDNSGPINNWGAVQAKDSEPGFMATDTSPNKVSAGNPCGYYDHRYRVYATPEEGARHFVKHMTVLRPHSWDAMKKGDIDEWAQRMHAVLINGKPKLDPISETPGYFEQQPTQRAKTIAKYVGDIAFTLGEPVAAKQGGPVSPEEALGQTTTDEDGGGFELPGGGQVAGPAVILAGVAGLIATVYKWGWPWTWRF